jgi:hypothetical protein
MGDDYELPDTFWKMPESASATVTTRQLRRVLVKHEGQIIAKGEFWSIQQKHLGAGVYRIWLEPEKPRDRG